MRPKLNKVSICALLLGIMIISCSFRTEPNATNGTEIESYGNNVISIMKDLKYDVNPKVILKEKKPDSKWVLKKTHLLRNVCGFKAIKVMLYTDKGKPGKAHVNLYIHAFLNDGRKTYFIGNLSNFGVQSVSVAQRDVTDDKRNELIVCAPDFHVRTAIIGYDQQRKRWEILLNTGGIGFIDFDGSGKQMLTTLGTGSISPQVHIHFWRKDHFETLNCEATLGLGRIGIHKEGQQVYLVEDFIEAGKIPRCFQFLNGELLEVDKSFIRK